MKARWLVAPVFLCVACGGGGGSPDDSHGADALIADLGHDAVIEAFDTLEVEPTLPTYADEPFLQDIPRWFTTADGLGSDSINSVFVEGDGSVLVATDTGVSRGTNGVFTPLSCTGAAGPFIDAVSDGSAVAFLANGSLWVRKSDGACSEEKLPSAPSRIALAGTDPFSVLVAGAEGVYGWNGGPLVTIPGTDGKAVTDVADIGGGSVAAATGSCLVVASKSGSPTTLCKAQGLPSDDVRAVAWDEMGGLLWVGTSLGVASWKPGEENATPVVGEIGGLPYDDVTRIAVGDTGMVAAGTPMGAMRRQAEGSAVPGESQADRWRYVHGRNLVPDDLVRDLAVGPEDELWIATGKGLARITRVPATLEQKAAFFDEATHLRHDRMGMVSPCNLQVPGDLDSFQMRDDDNDGQWTEMYLAAQSFRCAVNGGGDGCDFARTSMEAMLKLESVTEIPGFFARSIVPGDECESKQGGKAEWHLTSDEKWCWKGDTSTDEFVGHIFGLSTYYDLVATPDEKDRIAATIGRILTRIIEFGYYIADVDGQATTDGHFDPGYINTVGQFGDAGLNSAMILGGLRFGEKITGDAKFGEAWMFLAEDNGYVDNVRRMLEITHAFWINHDQHEMIMLALYPLLKYEDDPDVRAAYLQGLEDIWQNQRPERNPEFNMIYAALTGGSEVDLDVSARTLREMPWDLVVWHVNNSHRKDYELDPEPDRFGDAQSLAVFPYDERHVMKWNSNPFALDGGGNGHQEETGTHWLLPYWMGRYYGLITAPESG